METVEALAVAGGLWDNDEDPHSHWMFEKSTKTWYRMVRDENTGGMVHSGHRVNAPDLWKKVDEGKSVKDLERRDRLHHRRERKEYTRLLRFALTPQMVSALEFDFCGQNQGGYPSPVDLVEPDTQYIIQRDLTTNGLLTDNSVPNPFYAPPPPPGGAGNSNDAPPPPPPRGANNVSDDNKLRERLNCGHFSDNLQPSCWMCQQESTRLMKKAIDLFADHGSMPERYQMDAPFQRQTDLSDAKQLDRIQQLERIQKARDEQNQRDEAERLNNAASTQWSADHGHKQRWNRFTPGPENQTHPGTHSRRWKDDSQTSEYHSGQKRKGESSSGTMDYREKEKEKGNWQNYQKHNRGNTQNSDGWIDYSHRNHRTWVVKDPERWNKDSTEQWNQPWKAWNKNKMEENTAPTGEHHEEQEQGSGPHSSDQNQTMVHNSDRLVGKITVQPELPEEALQNHYGPGYKIYNKHRTEETNSNASSAQLPLMAEHANKVNKTGPSASTSWPSNPKMFHKGEAILGTEAEYDEKIGQALQERNAASSMSSAAKQWDVTQDVPAQEAQEQDQRVPTTESHTATDVSSSTTPDVPAPRATTTSAATTEAALAEVLNLHKSGHLTAEHLALLSDIVKKSEDNVNENN